MHVFSLSVYVFVPFVFFRSCLVVSCCFFVDCAGSAFSDQNYDSELDDQYILMSLFSDQYVCACVVVCLLLCHHCPI